MEFTLSEAMIYYQNSKLDEWIQKFLRAQAGEMPNPNYAITQWKKQWGSRSIKRLDGMKKI